MALRLGIDDAGRGPVIGPMILSGCILREEDEAELKKLGVKDSKELTPKRREFLANIIREKAVAYEVMAITASQIDELLNSGTNLNEVESNGMAQVINRLTKGKGEITVIIDCPATTIQKWLDKLRGKVEDSSKLTFICEHKADQLHVSVSAASILAKSRREEEMAKLNAEYNNEMGSGYPSDPTTKRFLEKYALRYEQKGIFRTTWKTWQNAVKEKKQQTLF